MTVASAFSAIRRGSKKLGKSLPVRKCGFRFKPAGYSDLKPATIPI